VADLYADIVASIAAAVAATSLGWQIKGKWWDRPAIVVDGVTASSLVEQSATMTGAGIVHAGVAQTTGWHFALTVSNVGDAATTLLGCSWLARSSAHPGFKQRCTAAQGLSPGLFNRISGWSSSPVSSRGTNRLHSTTSSV
jgi:hypothetical protein